MDESDGALTSLERGDTHRGLRGVGRVTLLIGVIVLVGGVVLAGNFVQTGTFVPWAATTGRSDTAVVGDGPSPATTPGASGTDAAPRTPAERVAAEDARLAAVASLPSDDPALLNTWNTVVLAPRNGQPTVYTGVDLLALGALRPDDDLTSTLVRNVVIRSGAELDLAGSYQGQSGTYRLASGPQLTTSIVAWGGSLGIVGAEGAPAIITSWDDTTGGPDLDESDGRAYIRARDGALALTSVSVEHLGYWSGRTGGLSATGSGSGTVAVALNDVQTVGLHYGFFGSDTTAVGILNSRFEGSAMTGIELTNSAASTTIQGATVTASGTDGIAVSRQSKDVRITDTTVEKSARWGIHVDGSALASGPTTGGYGLTPSSGFTLTGSRVAGNRDGGVRVISTDATEIRDSTVEEQRTALLIEGPSTGLTVADSRLSSNELRGLDVSGRITDATVSGSHIVGRRIGVELSGAAVVITKNDVSVASGFAIELAEDARADITDNTFHGVGQDAVALWTGSRTMQSGNDEGDWRFEWAWVGWMNEHPMMWLWALVLLVPAIGMPVLWRRRREHRRLRELLREALLRHGEEQVAAYRAVSAPAGDATGATPTAVPAFAAAAEAPATVSAADGAPAVRGPAPREARRTVAPYPGASRAPSPSRPRSFADLRTGALEGRTFASLRDFAVAAVVEGGYPVSTISRLFRIQQWRLQQWADEALLANAAPSKEGR